MKCHQWRIIFSSLFPEYFPQENYNFWNTLTTFCIINSFKTTQRQKKSISRIYWPLLWALFFHSTSVNIIVDKNNEKERCWRANMRNSHQRKTSNHIKVQAKCFAMCFIDKKGLIFLDFTELTKAKEIWQFEFSFLL